MSFLEELGACHSKPSNWQFQGHELAVRTSRTVSSLRGDYQSCSHQTARFLCILLILGRSFLYILVLKRKNKCDFSWKIQLHCLSLQKET